MSHIALGITGSVAAIRTPALVDAFRSMGHDVRVIATEPSLYFFDFAALPDSREIAPPPLGNCALFRDADEWPGRGDPTPRGGRYHRDDPVLHIELRRWAEVLVIAPLDANTLAKLSQGLSDNLLTCLYRAWDRSRPIVLAPAMNTFMWENPLTNRHLRMLMETHGISAPPAGVSLDQLMEFINESAATLSLCPPQFKRLACGDEGMGAIAEIADIAGAVIAALDRAGVPQLEAAV